VKLDIRKKINFLRSSKCNVKFALVAISFFCMVTSHFCSVCYGTGLQFHNYYGSVDMSNYGLIIILCFSVFLAFIFVSYDVLFGLLIIRLKCT